MNERVSTDVHAPSTNDQDGCVMHRPYNAIMSIRTTSRYLLVYMNISGTKAVTNVNLSIETHLKTYQLIILIVHWHGQGTIVTGFNL